MKIKKLTFLILNLILTCALVFSMPVTAYAQSSDLSLTFKLTTNEGLSEVFVDTNDEITVSFVIQRNDSTEGFTLNMLQNEIYYDLSFFELVEDSIVCTGDDGDAEKHVPIEYGVTIYCLKFGNISYDATVTYCTFKLKVIGTSGSGSVRNGAYENKYFALPGETAKTAYTQDLIVHVGAACEHTNKTTVSAKKPSCEEKGWDAYQTCNSCTAIFDQSGNLIADVPYLPISHSFDDKLSFDENGHWYQCSLCEEKSEYAAHAGGTATCENKAICSDCGQEYGDIDTNNHSSETIIKNHKITWFFGNGYSGDIHCADCGEMIEKGETVSMYNVMAWPLWVWVLAILFLPVVLGGWGIVWMLGVISTFIL